MPGGCQRPTALNPEAEAACAAQSGNLDYHTQSLQNLAAAVKQARRLCAVMVDTIGRELIIRRPHDLDETARPPCSHALQPLLHPSLAQTRPAHAHTAAACCRAAPGSPGRPLLASWQGSGALKCTVPPWLGGTAEASPLVQGWPVYRDSIEVKAGQKIVVTAAEDGADDTRAEVPRLPVSNPTFVEVCCARGATGQEL